MTGVISTYFHCYNLITRVGYIIKIYYKYALIETNKLYVSYSCVCGRVVPLTIKLPYSPNGFNITDMCL